MKKLLTILLTLVMVTSLFTACGTSDGGTETSSSSKKSKGSATLDVSVFAQEHEQEMYRSIMKQFEEKNDCTVNFSVAGDQYWPELEAAITANTEPDIFYLGVSDIKRRVWADKITPLDELLDVQSLDKIWPEALNLYKYDEENDILSEGSIYALPKDFSAVSMVVNTAILDKRADEIQALVDSGALPFLPEVDADGNLPVYTFTEFATLCSTLTFEDDSLPETAGSKQVYGTHLWEDFTLQNFIWGADGEVLNQDHTKVQFNSPEFIDGYQGFMKIVELGGSGSSTDETTGYLKFLAGRCAYFPCGTWDVGAFQAVEEDEAINPNKEWFAIELAPWPISDKYTSLSIEDRQDKWAGRIDSIGYCVANSSDNKELAAELAYLLSADEEVQLFLAEQGGQLPNIEEMARTTYLEDDKFYPKNREIFVNMLSGENGHRLDTTYTFNQLWWSDGFISGVDSVWSFYEGIDKGVTPMDVTEYCNSIQDGAQTLLEEGIADQEEIKP